MLGKCRNSCWLNAAKVFDMIATESGRQTRDNNKSFADKRQTLQGFTSVTRLIVSLESKWSILRVGRQYPSFHRAPGLFESVAYSNSAKMATSSPILPLSESGPFSNTLQSRLCRLFGRLRVAPHSRICQIGLPLGELPRFQICQNRDCILRLAPLRVGPILESAQKGLRL